MITTEEVRERASKRTRAQRGAWGADRLRPDAEPVTWQVALHPPTEREMRADEHAAELWARQWQRVDDAHATSGLRIEWTSRAWLSIGRQRVPTHAVFCRPDAIAEFAGGDEHHSWLTLRARADLIASRFGRSPALAAVFKRHASTILSLAEADFDTLLAVTLWLKDNDASGMRPRQLPIRGVDTKWFSAHRPLVSALCEAVRGDALSIVTSDSLIRVRVLDSSLAMGGLRDFAASPAQLNELEYLPGVVFVFENLESLLAMPDWPGAIAVHGSGYAVDALGNIRWITNRPVIYWGDLDSHGFAILHRLRKHHSDIASALMDKATLLRYRDLWVAEPTPARGALDTLTASEAEALRCLRAEGDVRLEQERIPWATALTALRRAAEGLPLLPHRPPKVCRRIMRESLNEQPPWTAPGWQA
ncbi:Wadjet anti-phage system protein JetD domain-containing protein [Leucobacter luti]|uniref:Wadjet anti-phage system protein JetD domain-containing protein n=1 Tax=Leucobacter luti TaxID=340320 RepID=UPI003D068B78